MEGRDRFIADALDLTELEVLERDLDFTDVAQADLAAFEAF